MVFPLYRGILSHVLALAVYASTCISMSLKMQMQMQMQMHISARSLFSNEDRHPSVFRITETCNVSVKRNVIC
ncbi:hypothetical protein QFZ89_005243 [Paraburkholderia youngii]